MLGEKINSDTFFGEYFEKNFLHIHGVFSTRLVNWSRLNDVLFQIDPSDSAAIRVFKKGPISTRSYTEKYQDINELKSRFLNEELSKFLAAGATLVINRLDTKELEIARICKNLSDYLGLKVTANGYIAFGGDGSFGKHWDTHDVFAIQVIGRKRWKVYRPTFNFPLSHQRSRNFKADCPELPAFDHILEEGDFLYIPRGWWHEAIPLPGQETFHIAAGVHTATMLDYLAWLTNEVFPAEELARKSSLHSADYKRFARYVSEKIVSPEVIQLFRIRMNELNNQFQSMDLNNINVKEVDEERKYLFNSLPKE